MSQVGRRGTEEGRATSGGRSTVLVWGTSFQTPPRTGRVSGQVGQRGRAHLGTRQTSFTGTTRFTRGTFGASGAGRATFTSGTLVGGVTGTIRVSSLGFFTMGQCLNPPRGAGWGALRGTGGRGKVKVKPSVNRVRSHGLEHNDWGRRWGVTPQGQERNARGAAGWQPSREGS